MHFYISLFTIICLLPKAFTISGISSRLRQTLEAEHLNALCCLRDKKCCKQPSMPSKSPTFEVKMILTDCPNTFCTNASGQIVVDSKKSKECEKVTNCQQKFLITINIVNYGQPRNNKSQYLVIDHVTDPQTKKKIQILNPYVLRIRQAPLYQIYDLEFERTVNSEAKEKVIRKRSSASSVVPRDCSPSECGVLKYNGKVVPFSDGFCCSCNNKEDAMPKNAAEFEGQWPNSVKVEERGLPDANKNWPRDYYRLHHGFIGGHEDGGLMAGPSSPERLSGDDGRRPMGDREAVYGSQRHADESVNYRQFGRVKDAKYGRNDDGRSRLSFERISMQRRGGQSCEDKFNPSSSFESTHCLTFSNMWYSVYELKKPRVEHRLQIQIYRKCENCHGKTGWKDITKGDCIDIGTVKPKYCNTDRTIAAKYEADEPSICNSALDYKTQKLLIPEKRVVNPEQFLVVPKEHVSDGKSCDTAGVGYEAFYKQAKRCAQLPGSCLQNQPKHLHEHDQHAERKGKRGFYFLKYFGTLPTDSVGRQTTGQEKDIKLLYTKNHTSSVYMEVEADYVTTITENSLASITEIYVEATNPTKTKITVKVMNAGLTYGVFYVRMSGCPLDVPASFNNIASKSVLIAPQDQHIYNLHIECPLQLDEFSCFIQVDNTNQELIAIRKVRIHKHDRCICIWHCECSCYDTDGALKCTPLSLKDYQAAGFQGGLPVATTLIESSYLDEMLGLFFHMFLILISSLLLMGLVKALLGFCSTEIGMWGLDVILGHRTYDCVSNSKTPKAMKPNISFATQFCLNVVFFFVYPLALINMVIKKMCFSSATDESVCTDATCPAKISQRSKSRSRQQETTSDSGSVRKRTAKGSGAEDTDGEQIEETESERERSGERSSTRTSTRTSRSHNTSDASRPSRQP